MRTARITTPRTGTFFHRRDTGKKLLAPQPAGICGIWVVNTAVVYACGTWYGPGRVIKTTDGGHRWPC